MNSVHQKSNKHLINLIVLLVLIIITLSVLFLSYQELNFKNISVFIKGSNPWFLVLSFLCMVLGIFIEAVSLKVISRKLGQKSKFISMFAYASADVYYSAITPSATGGQPASAYYMVKDGIGAGTASFTLVFNAIAYISSLMVLTVVAFALRPSMFMAFPALTKFFVFLGIIIQLILLVFLFACIKFNKFVLKVGNGVITFLVKIKLIKKEEKWRKKLSVEVGKYAACFQAVKKSGLLFIEALLINCAFRVSRVLISCFICLAAAPETSFWSIFALQAFLTVGYTSLPLPGGTGAFEYLYLRIYRLIYTDDAFILSAMMVMRTVSYYLSLILSGAVTLAYHVHLMRKHPPVQAENTVKQEIESVNAEGGGQTADGNTEADGLPEEPSEEEKPEPELETE